MDERPRLSHAARIGTLATGLVRILGVLLGVIVYLSARGAKISASGGPEQLYGVVAQPVGAFLLFLSLTGLRPKCSPTESEVVRLKRRNTWLGISFAVLGFFWVLSHVSVVFLAFSDSAQISAAIRNATNQTALVYAWLMIPVCFFGAILCLGRYAWAPWPLRIAGALLAYVFPLGTGLGIWTWWFLNKSGGAFLYSPNDDAVPRLYG